MEHKRLLNRRQVLVMTNKLKCSQQLGHDLAVEAAMTG
jgi:hypothetical protein